MNLPEALAHLGKAYGDLQSAITSAEAAVQDIPHDALVKAVADARKAFDSLEDAGQQLKEAIQDLF